MGSIRRRNGRYQAQIRRQGVQNITKTFSTIKDAKVWVRGIETRIDAGDINIAVPKAVTLGDLLQRYGKEVTVHKKGQPQEERRISRLLKDPITKVLLANLTSAQLATFRDRRMLDGVRAAQIDLVLIRHCLNLAKREWGVTLPSNPVNEIKIPNGVKHRSRRLMQGEYDRLKKASLLSKNPDFWPMVEFALETAMRKGEILSLKWENINLEECIADLDDTKNGDRRLVPLSPKAIDILISIASSEGFVFKTTDGAIRNAWNRLVRRAGIDDLRFHDLRHEAVSRLFEKGLNISEVSTVSGHKDPRMLFKYTHPRMETILAKL